VHTAGIHTPIKITLLATARIEIINNHGMKSQVRALLDQGSEVSFISESIVQLLALPKRRVEVTLTGIGACKAGTTRGITNFELRSIVAPEFSLSVEAYVLPRLSAHIPATNLVEIPLSDAALPSLADPQFNSTGSIDIILGADVYGLLLRQGLRRVPGTQLVAQNTALGWIMSGSLSPDLSGRAEAHPERPFRALHCSFEEQLIHTLEKFWKVEEVSSPRNKFTAEEMSAEKLFVTTHRRDATGRYVVRLPLKVSLPDASAETRRMAAGSLHHMHRRFNRDPELAKDYREFMEAYERLGHMERVPAKDLSASKAWYLPHHAVVSTTTNKRKIRVVFDASRQTREELCLNDFLLPGPPLQGDLPLILANWRHYRFAFTADIVKMFRQIQVDPADQDLQRIVWAPRSDLKPVEYRLKTVTYGTSCAPYLA
jgi:hypothetical protein